MRKACFVDILSKTAERANGWLHAPAKGTDMEGRPKVRDVMLTVAGMKGCSTNAGAIERKPLAGDKPMLPVDGSFLYNLGKQLAPLLDLKAETSLGDAAVPLIVAEWSLETLLHQSVFRLRTSRADGLSLLETLSRVRQRGTNEDGKTPIGWPDLSAISRGLSQFEAVFAAEMRVSSMYLVTQKKGLDTLALLADGAVQFPSELEIKVPAALPDAREAMKCIIFELPTAAGFHLHRANESVLRKYYHAVTGGKAPPKTRNIGDYLHELDTQKAGDKIVKAALRDLKDLHRNPLIHPEHSLESVDEAYALYCGVFAAMEAMLKAIPAPVAPSGIVPPASP